MNNLFCYGTLQDSEIQEKHIGRIIKGIPDKLAGFGKSKIKLNGKIYPILIPQKDSVIEGEVFSVTDNEMKKIDEYEGDAYKRINVRLESGKIAMVYIKNLWL